VLFVAAALALSAVPALAGAAPHAPARPSSGVATPTLEGPITTGNGISLVTTLFDLGRVGYERNEYFFGGTATAYEPAQPLTPDGRWQLRPTTTAPYRTRMVVYRPVNPKNFDGTVYVEWLNVTSGFETSAVWGLVHNQVLRSGAVWIGVSAQAGGVQGGDFVIPGATPGGIRAADPVRYASLTHPGDLYSFDIYSQAGVAARGRARGPNPLGGLKAKRVIAIGKSQSAFRLVDYVDGVQPHDHVYDGFLIASRHASGAPLGHTPFGLADDTVPPITHIRTDSDATVFVVETETDLGTYLKYPKARQPDSPRFRSWEIAGAAHADTYSGVLGLTDLGDGAAERAILDPTALSGGPLRCTTPVNAGPAFAVLSAATAHLERWVRDGTPPPHAPPIATKGTDPAVIQRDAHGNAIGGLRTPLVDVPLTTITGDRNAGGVFCDLFGTTAALDPATVAALYPSHADYVRRFTAATKAAVRKGFLLRPEAQRFEDAAKGLAVPPPLVGTASGASSGAGRPGHPAPAPLAAGGQ
jgi:hypothetical protein